MSEARNKGIRVSRGEYLYFYDPDDELAPDALETAYNKAVETDSDAVQFDFQVVKGSDTTPIEGRNGNKREDVYEGDNVLRIFMPRFIGYSVTEVQDYGSSRFFTDKDMCTVWRFIYRRSVVVDNNLCFSPAIHLGEDTLFNCWFFLYAKRICYIKKVLYTYYSKDGGALISSLRKMETLLDNKIAAADERERIRKKLLVAKHIDIFNLYAGSLFLSAVELAVKSSSASVGSGKFLQYVRRNDVKKAITAIPLKGGTKIKVLLLLFKMRLYHLIYVMISLADRLHLFCMFFRQSKNRKDMALGK